MADEPRDDAAGGNPLPTFTSAFDPAALAGEDGEDGADLTFDDAQDDGAEFAFDDAHDDTHDGSGLSESARQGIEAWASGHRAAKGNDSDDDDEDGADQEPFDDNEDIGDAWRTDPRYADLNEDTARVMIQKRWLREEVPKECPTPSRQPPANRDASNLVSTTSSRRRRPKAHALLSLTYAASQAPRAATHLDFYLALKVRLTRGGKHYEQAPSWRRRVR